MLLDKKILALASVTNESNGRYNLQHIKINRTEAMATDGNILVRVPAQTIPVDEFPVIPGAVPTNEEEIYLHADAAKTISKKLPKRCRTLPILENALVCQNGDKALKVVSTDLETTETTEAKKPEAGFEYPDVEKCYPKGEPVLTVGLGLEALKNLLGYLSSADKDIRGIKFEFYGPLEPVKFTAIGGYIERAPHGLVMPYRVDK